MIQLGKGNRGRLPLVSLCCLVACWSAPRAVAENGNFIVFSDDVDLIAPAQGVAITGNGFGVLDNGAVVRMGALVKPVGLPLNGNTEAKLSDDLEKKLAEFVIKAAEFKRKDYDDHMKDVIDEVVKVTQGGGELQRNLQDVAQKAKDTAMNQWKEKLTSDLRGYMVQAGSEAARLVGRWPAEMIAKNQNVGVPSPEDLPEWKDGLKQKLSTDQMVAWQGKLKEQDQQQEKMIADYLQPLTEQCKERQASLMTSEVSELTMVLKLPDDRVHQLDEAAKKAVDQSVDAWSKSVAGQIRGMEENQQRMVVGRGGTYYSEIEDKDRPDRQEVWTKRLQEVLTPEELKNWKASQEDRAQRRRQAMATMVVVELDKKLMFTSAQRNQIEPLLTNAVAELEKTTAAENWALPPTLLDNAARQVNEEQIRPVLDTVQWEHWKQLGNGDAQNQSPIFPGVRRWNGGARAEFVRAEADAADQESIVSDFLYQRATQERARLLSTMRLYLEDVHRVITLPQDSRDRLETAAKGAVEASLGTWKNNFEGWLRSSTKGVIAQDMRHRLASLGNVSFGRENNILESTWNSAVSEVLSKAQLEAWQREVDARTAYREKSATACVIAELDRRRHLTTAQVEKITPLLQTTIHDYLPDLCHCFSADWQLQSYYVLIPLKGIPSKDIESVLTPEQWRLCNEQDFGPRGDYWNSVEQRHKYRLKGGQRVRNNSAPMVNF